MFSGRPIGVVTIAGTWLWAAAIWPTQISAMPANPRPVSVQQPDGSTVTLRVFGDEHFHWYEDLRGYTVVASAGTYVYATLDDRGRLAPTPWVVGKADPVAAGLAEKVFPPEKVFAELQAESLPQPAARGGPLRAVPPSGTVKNLVVLCKFSDHTFGVHTRDAADYDVLWNAVGGDPVLAPTGSVRDCFFENSYGILTLDSTVAAWVTLPHPEAYYTNGTSGLGGFYPENPQGMVEHALNAVDALIDFGDFDTDNDGYIDAISIIHSGYGAETGGGGGFWMWSHRWSLWQLPAGQWISSDLNALGENVKVYDYHTEPALWGTSGTTISRIGVAVHETGHFFGLPDLYDINGGGQGIGSYCMMANAWGFDGSQLFPPHFSAWCKIELGWVTPTSISTPGMYFAPQVQTTPTVFRIDQGYPGGEYLLVENRQPFGFDAMMPQGGLAVWHIDDAKCCNTDQGYPGQPGWPQNNQHYRVALLQADGNYELERNYHRGDGDELFHAGGAARIDANTVPNTDAYQHGNVFATHNAITDISSSGPNMSFNYDVLVDCNANSLQDAQDIAAGTSADCNANLTPDECELIESFFEVSPALSPIGTGSPQSHTFVSPPPPAGDVTLSFEAIGDFSSFAERVDVNINGTYVGSIFFVGNDCPSSPNGDGFLVPAATFNAAVAGGNATINMIASPDVNPALCDTSNFIRVSMTYPVAGDTCNGNGIPDDCDIAAGTSADCNANGQADECETLISGTLLDADFESGLPAGWATSGIMHVTSQCANTTPECGGTTWAYAGDSQSCAYGDNQSGALIAPPVTLGYSGNQLHFCSRMDTEAGWDFVRVKVNGATVWQASGGTGQWQTEVVDLSAFAGKTVTLSFEFASDPFFSGTLGWQIDNVLLETGAADCNGNAVPDSCEPQIDCNNNGTQDICDIALGLADDCNLNGLIDDCELAGGTAQDCNSNSVPDDCDPDFDGDSIPDDCDPCAGGAASGDTDANGAVDLDDFADLVQCLGGPGIEEGGAGCECFDFDGDNDYDLADYAVLQIIFNP